jgi:antitoxin VapB
VVLREPFLEDIAKETLLYPEKLSPCVPFSSRQIVVYMPSAPEAQSMGMRRKAKIFMNNRNQAVRLPKEFQFKTQEVFIRKEGSEIALSPRPTDWSSYLAEGLVASAVPPQLEMEKAFVR